MKTKREYYIKWIDRFYNRMIEIDNTIGVEAADEYYYDRRFRKWSRRDNLCHYRRIKQRKRTFDKSHGGYLKQLNTKHYEAVVSGEYLLPVTTSENSLSVKQYTYAELAKDIEVKYVEQR